MRIAGSFTLLDGTKETADFCPFCGSDELQLQRKDLKDGFMYTFVQCVICKGSSGSSSSRLRKYGALCDKEAIKKWNERARISIGETDG